MSDHDDIPELTADDFARARPFSEVFPEQHRAWKKNLGGRPKAAAPKVHIGFRLAGELVNAIKAGGKGYNARVEAVLMDALKQGKL